MAVFRVEKSRDYTVMCNHHLRDKTLSLKAKGLLSQMLSLPDDWDYTLRGLAAINMEKLDAVRTAVLELERRGYIVRQQGRAANGKLAAVEYTIFEHPQHPAAPRLENPNTAEPTLEEPRLDFPNTVKPNTDNPYTGNPTQSNTDQTSPKKSNTDQSIYQSVFPPAEEQEGQMDAMDVYRELICRNLDYEALCGKYGQERMDGMVALILDTVCTAKRYIRIQGEERPAEVVKSVLLKLNSLHIQYVFERMDDNPSKIRNIKGYLLTALYNAQFTMDSHYRAEVNHDLYGDFDELI